MVHNVYCSADFFEQYPRPQEEVSIVEQSSCTYKKSHDNFLPSVSSLLSGINMVAFGYVSCTLYKRYYLINYSPPPEQNLTGIHNALYTLYAKTFPGLVRLSTKTHFCIDATLMAFEAFLYKTIAQLIVVCCCCDVIDMFEMGLRRTKNIIKVVCD